MIKIKAYIGVGINHNITKAVTMALKSAEKNLNDTPDCILFFTGSYSSDPKIYNSAMHLRFVYHLLISAPYFDLPTSPMLSYKI